jgi:hypothetical protein
MKSYFSELATQQFAAEVVNADHIRTPFPCNIEQRAIDRGFFLSDLPTVPILFRRKENANLKVQSASSKQMLTGDIYGDQPVVLSSSNTYSHDKLEMTLRDYINTMNDHVVSKSNETFYLFGNNDGGVWSDLEQMYEQPPYIHSKVAGAVTFGIGGVNSGVSFHMHGPGFSEVIHGSKRFFLFPADVDTAGLFDPDISQAEWMVSTYPSAKNDQSRPLYECTIYPGEILYFPDKWMHATLNVEDYNVFVSVFLDLQLVKLDKVNSKSSKARSKSKQ